MTRKLVVSLLVGGLALTLVGTGYAAKKGGAQKLIATYFNQPSFGVESDGNTTYDDGVNGVQVYFGVSGKDVDLVTYNTPRKLRFKFDPTAPAFVNSGIANVHPSGDFMAESDLFGINYWGRYRDMGIGTTAQVQSDLEFYVGRITYELDYASLAVKRLDADTWLFTTDPADIGGDPGFTASPTATLNVIRRRSVTSFGTVDMPMRFEVSYQ